MEGKAVVALAWGGGFFSLPGDYTGQTANKDVPTLDHAVVGSMGWMISRKIFAGTLSVCQRADRVRQ